MNCDECGAYSESPNAKAVCIYCHRAIIRRLTRINKTQLGELKNRSKIIDEKNAKIKELEAYISGIKFLGKVQ